METLRRHYLRHHDGRPAYEIGGGTILAARFGHRTSTDIDLTTTDPQKALITMAATGRGLAEAAAGALGARQSAQETRITTPHGRVDITAMRAMPEGQERHAIVDGEVETVLSTAQILHGKLMRADESPARDAYDVVTAGRPARRTKPRRGRTHRGRAAPAEHRTAVDRAERADNRRSAPIHHDDGRRAGATRRRPGHRGRPSA